VENFLLSMNCLWAVSLGSQISQKKSTVSRHVVAGGKLFVADELSVGSVVRFTDFSKKNSTMSRHAVAGGKLFVADELSAGDVAWFINLSKKYLAVAPHCRGW
jgi:hypothetical protein